MSALTRQNTLFVAEDWVRIYEALENVDFRAYDFNNLVQALLEYLRSNYPEQFNDWVASSEFVTKIEILAWLSQNIAFRVDLNTRENFLATAERRDSLIRLAQNIGYKINRVRSSSGVLKLKSIRTTQSIIDSNGQDLRNKTILWNDTRDEDWFERFITILNSAFVTRTQFGFPLNRYNAGGVRSEQYIFNSAAPASGSYRFTANINGLNLPFDIYNAKLNPDTGQIEEYAPDPRNAYNVFYMLDGRGFNSEGTGFFLPFKQGNLSFQDEIFANPEVLRTFTLPATNVNNDDFFVQQIDQAGNTLSEWTQVDTTFGEGVSFNTLSAGTERIFEIDTLVNDQVRVRFGDGTFGQIPVGRFRFWYRTSNPTPIQIRPKSIQNQTITIPYVSGNDLYQLTMSYSLQTTVSNGTSTESNFDIRTRAGKVFYTQNRMVNSQDYNNFFLKDSTIQKVKTVNRTFAGQSRYARLNDPTSLYQNVKHVAEDGRLYQDFTINIAEYSADPDVLAIDSLMNQFVKPLLFKADKRILYYNLYAEVVLPPNYRWNTTSIIAAQSRGNVLLGTTVQTVGNTGIGPLAYIDADAILRFDGPTGLTSGVDRVVETGTATDGVILKDIVPTGESIFSVFPALRNRFSADEEIELTNRLNYRLDFAISWKQSTQSWVFINSDDINRSGQFALVNQGNTSGSASDASWLIFFEYVPNGSEPKWRITDRGLSLFFESAREVDFIFANQNLVIDPETGRVAQDTISLLESNESRDSLRRRGLDELGLGACEFVALEFTGTGTTRLFQTQQTELDAERTVVLVNGIYQIPGVDYIIIPNPLGSQIQFTVAPPEGAQLLVYYSSRFRNATQTAVRFTGNGVQTEFDLGVRDVNANNVIAFTDGIIQNSSLDFGIGTAVNGNSAIVFGAPIPTGVVLVVYVLYGIDNSVLTKNNYIGDGTTTAMQIPTLNQSLDTVLVSIDGIVQRSDKYTVVAGPTFSTVTFVTPPPLGTFVRITSVSNVNLTRTNQYRFAPTGTNNSFTLANNTGITAAAPGLIVALDGVMQEGPWGAVPQWTITGGNTIFFNSPPPADTLLQVFYIAGSQGVVIETDPIVVVPVDPGTRPPLDVESCLVSFLGRRVDFTPNDVIRHLDGYVNKNGLLVSPIDSDYDGIYDTPFIYKDLVIQDGQTDLVLWREIQEFGFTVLDPITPYTSPSGTYGNSAQGDIAEGQAVDPTRFDEGDIHFDVLTKTWLIVDGNTDTWVLAPDQTKFKWLIGRDNLSFIWTHYAPEANRIDPSKSNIMNVYVLTSGFDTAYRTWLSQNGPTSDRPEPETSEQLRLQYADFEEFTPISDSIIFYPSRYKPLFGEQAVPELRATFKIIQTPGSSVSESDLKLRVLAAIRSYFSVTRWDFGEKFYFTELVAFVHIQLAPDLQSMVIVPRENNQAFGRMFQVRAEPDELFISAATPDNIEVVPFFTDDEIRVGVMA